MDRNISELDCRPADKLVRELFEGSFKRVKAKTCLYNVSKDGHFILDKVPGHENVVVACGFSGHGFKFGITLGKILRDLAVTGKHLSFVIVWQLLCYPLIPL